MKKVNPKKLTEPLRYDNLHDILMRLSCSILTYDGEPCYVTDVYADDSPGGCITVQFPLREEDGNIYIINANDILLNVNQAPLGFINFKKSGCAYLTYPPVRSQRSGISIERLQLYYPGDGMGPGRLNTNSLREVCATIAGIYPSIKEAASECVMGPSSVYKSRAFSRHFALSPTRNPEVLSLIYKTTGVGVFLKRQNRFIVVDSRFDKTRELSLIEAINEKDNRENAYTIERLLG